ncbi:hypothetical protein LCGC14_0364600 [marine sediment metagenome]|uniref:ERF family protein n=1 Tax=marine sediment metagenome TaxID=412755 RepID=A0A0F9WFB2_9ZZZZ
MSNEIAVIEDGKNVIALIGKMAENPDVDVEKMAKLVELQEHIYDKQAEIAYSNAMQELQQEIPAIKALSINPQTKSKYAKLDHINSVITPIYTKHGFSLSFGMAECPIENWFRTTCTIRHKLGHSVKEFIDLPLDDTGIKGSVNKTPVHATGSSNSYARRYLTVMVFNLTIGGEDLDGNAPKEMTGDELIISMQGEVNDLLRKLPEARRVPYLQEMQVAEKEGHLSVDYLTTLKDSINSDLK